MARSTAAFNVSDDVVATCAAAEAERNNKTANAQSTDRRPWRGMACGYLHHPAAARRCAALSTAYLRRPVDFVTAVESRSEGHAIIADVREARVAIAAERGDDSRNGDRRVVRAEAGRARSYAFPDAELRWRLTARDMEASPG
jgi:hypothetical protein